MTETNKIKNKKEGLAVVGPDYLFNYILYKYSRETIKIKHLERRLSYCCSILVTLR